MQSNAQLEKRRLMTINIGMFTERPIVDGRSKPHCISRLALSFCWETLGLTLN